jgi:hypothetical protein
MDRETRTGRSLPYETKGQASTDSRRETLIFRKLRHRTLVFRQRHLREEQLLDNISPA